MKRRFVHRLPATLWLATWCLVLLCLPAQTSPPAASVEFCRVLDREEWLRAHPSPVAKVAAQLNVGEPRTVRLIYFLPVRTNSRWWIR